MNEKKILNERVGSTDTGIGKLVIPSTPYGLLDSSSAPKMGFQSSYSIPEFIDLHLTPKGRYRLL
ncbi:hypothetical protein T4B_13339 [Trichinella pseudospiralis]|uniref:Uncharacterized protein n=1 Tax=Trichinella pseudospiralis TaxID=6337 RepID=A0A0V1IJ32_TRIPS|nr:hypothetical protein T4B_13339 [Trichinella pseudospiralis]